MMDFICHGKKVIKIDPASKEMNLDIEIKKSPPW
jgi:hypothetical protein